MGVLSGPFRWPDHRAAGCRTRPLCLRHEFPPAAPGSYRGIRFFDALTAQLDKLRRSDNLFFAVRLDGRFAAIHVRVACKTAAGTPLTEATAHQAEFKMTDVPGTIVGFWSPPYARSINVAGWHLHFLTDDRKGGGHLLGCGGAGLEAKMEDLDDLRLAIPETTQFLHADLTQDPSEALDKAERAH